MMYQTKACCQDGRVGLRRQFQVLVRKGMVRIPFLTIGFSFLSLCFFFVYDVLYKCLKIESSFLMRLYFTMLLLVHACMFAQMHGKLMFIRLFAANSHWLLSEMLGKWETKTSCDCVRLAVDDGWCWLVMRELYCWLTGSWWLVLI